LKPNNLLVSNDVSASFAADGHNHFVGTASKRSLVDLLHACTFVASSMHWR